MGWGGGVLSAGRRLPVVEACGHAERQLFPVAAFGGGGQNRVLSSPPRGPPADLRWTDRRALTALLFSELHAKTPSRAGRCVCSSSKRAKRTTPPPRSAPIAGVIDDEIESVLDFGRRGSLRAASSGGGDDSTRLLRGGRAEHYITGCYMGFGSGRD